MKLNNGVEVQGTEYDYRDNYRMLATGKQIGNVSMYDYMHNYSPGDEYGVLVDGVTYHPAILRDDDRQGEMWEAYCEYSESCNRQGENAPTWEEYKSDPMEH